MSYDVYIALDGFKETPISPEAWLSAARQCHDLDVVEEVDRQGTTGHHVTLKADKHARMDLGPYGMVYAQNPSRELIVAMFNLASVLRAGVYSERLNRYDSVEDWERRTRIYRQSQDNRRARHRKKRRLRIVRGIAFAALLAAVGWLMVELILYIFSVTATK